MSKLQVAAELDQAHLPSNGKALYVPSASGRLIGWGTSVPSAAAGYAPGCLFVDTDGTAGAQVYINEGTATSCSFVAIGSNVIGGTGLWSNCPAEGAVAPSLAHFYFNDFLSDNDYNTTDWTVTTVEAGAGTASEALQDTVLGTLLLTNDDADDDADQINFKQETFKLAANKKLWMEINFQVSEATNLDFFVGLAEAEDLTAVADNMPANGIGFHKEDGDTNIDVSSSDNGTNLQTAAIATLAAATNVRLGLYFDGGATGSATITPYVNGTAGTAISSVTYATMAEMAPLFMVRNGSAASRTMTIDFIKVVQLR